MTTRAQRTNARQNKIWDKMMSLKTQGQIAYETELLARPNYHDGTPRRSWSRLDRLARLSWEKNATPRWRIDETENRERENRERDRAACEFGD